MKIYAKLIAAEATVVIVRLELNTLFLSVLGAKRIRERSKPSLEKSIISPRVEIRAVAVPTSSIEYALAATIQNKKPAAAFRSLLSAKNIEFL
jgi:hypothetical protein